MVHKLLPIELPEKKSLNKLFSFKIPDFTGKFGVSLFIGGKEVFLGVMIGNVTIEEIIKRKTIKIPKGKVRVFKFDPSA